MRCYNIVTMDDESHSSNSGTVIIVMPDGDRLCYDRDQLMESDTWLQCKTVQHTHGRRRGTSTGLASLVIGQAIKRHEKYIKLFDRHGESFFVLRPSQRVMQSPVLQMIALHKEPLMYVRAAVARHDTFTCSPSHTGLAYELVPPKKQRARVPPKKVRFLLPSETPQTARRSRCSARTLHGKVCRLRALRNSRYCHVHSGR